MHMCLRQIYPHSAHRINIKVNRKPSYLEYVIGYAKALYGIGEYLCSMCKG